MPSDVAGDITRNGLVNDPTDSEPPTTANTGVAMSAGERAHLGAEAIADCGQHRRRGISNPTRAQDLPTGCFPRRRPPISMAPALPRLFAVGSGSPDSDGLRVARRGYRAEGASVTGAARQRKPNENRDDAR